MKHYAIAAKTAVEFLLFLMLFSLFGCTAVGRLVPAENRLLFTEKATNSGTYSDAGFTVEYSYRLEGGQLALTGEIDYLGGVDSLNVYVLFIDAAGTVLQRKIIYYSGYRTSQNWPADRSFRETLAVLPGAAGISFDYSAQPRHHQR